MISLQALAVESKRIYDGHKLFGLPVTSALIETKIRDGEIREAQEQYELIKNSPEDFSIQHVAVALNGLHTQKEQREAWQLQVDERQESLRFHDYMSRNHYLNHHEAYQKLAVIDATAAGHPPNWD